MAQSVPISRADLAQQASILGNYERLLTLELGGRSTDEIYELVFSRLSKPDPFRLFGLGLGAEVPFMLGTDQRDHIVPRLAECLMPLRPGGIVLDVGSGDGQTTAYALEGRLQPLAFLPLDPAGGAIQRYRELFASRYPQMTVARALEAGIDEVVSAQPGSEAYLGERIDMAIVIHALYFTADVAAFLHFLHARLLPGGKLAIAFGEGGGRFSGALAEDYWAHHPHPGGIPAHAMGDALDRFFGLETPAKEPEDERLACEAALAQRLGRPLFRAAQVIRQPTRVFAHDFGDLLAMAFLTGLTPTSEAEMLQQVAFVSQRLLESPESFDLRLTLNGPRARMLSVAQPQVFLLLEKI